MPHAGRAALPLLLAIAAVARHAACDVRFRVLHINDVHGRVEPTSRLQGPCKTEDDEVGACVGGFAKIATVVKRERARGDVLVLDAGDQFMGTIWSTVYKGAATARFQNALGVDAMTLGNHEFDYGPGVLGAYIDGLEFPVLGANIDASMEPALAGKIANSTKVVVAGATVGVVGYSTPETPFQSSPGDGVTFAENLTAVVQAEIDKLRDEGVGIIVGLSHLGHAADIALVPKISGIDVVVGGHTHTKLEGADYPTFVADRDGAKVAVVQAFWAAQAVGVLEVVFSEGGDLLAAEGAPAVLGSDASNGGSFVEDDAEMRDLVATYKGHVDALRSQVIGHSDVVLDGERANIRSNATNLGNLICEAMRWFADRRTSLGGGSGRLGACLISAGAVRGSIDRGAVTLEEVATVLPFGNALSVVVLTPAQVYQALDHGVQRWESGSLETGEFPQVAGIRFVFCEERPGRDKVFNVEVFDGRSFVPIQRAQAAPTVKVVTNGFLAGGGDMYTVLKSAEKVSPLGPPLDVAVREYISAFSPLAPQADDRIRRDCRSDMGKGDESSA